MAGLADYKAPPHRRARRSVNSSSRSTRPFARWSYPIWSGAVNVCRRCCSMGFVITGHALRQRFGGAIEGGPPPHSRGSTPLSTIRGRVPLRLLPASPQRGKPALGPLPKGTRRTSRRIPTLQPTRPPGCCSSGRRRMVATGLAHTIPLPRTRRPTGSPHPLCPDLRLSLQRWRLLWTSLVVTSRRSERRSTSAST
ncbi:hypothetical protein BC826DRAFT_1020280 [Russula brevipes]|nr:hypothetical protein BC826DRAFT_1020280 [Russula brevipes]